MDNGRRSSQPGHGRRLARFVLLIAASGLAALLLFIFLTSLQGSFPFGAYIDLGRTYLFRNALANSLLVMGMAGAGGILLWLLLARWPRGETPAWFWFAPLLLPSAVAALLWQQGLNPWGDWLLEPWIARGVMALVALWWITPLLRVAHARRMPWRWWSAGLLAAFVAAGDIVTPLLLTRGEPFNATQTLASWTYQQLAVNHDMIQGAASAMIWLGLLAIVGLPVLAFTSFVGKAGTRTAGHGLTVGGTLLTCWAWLPLALALLAGLWQGFAPPAWTRFGLLLLPLALMGVALVLGAVGARWIGGPAAGALQQRGGVERTAHVLGALALLSWPAMPVFLAIVLQPTAPGGGIALMLLWLLSAMIGLTGGVAMALATKADYPDAIRLVALTTAFVIWHGYPAAAFVQRQGVTPDISTATVAHFGAPGIGVSSTLWLLSLAMILLGGLAWWGIRRFATRG